MIVKFAGIAVISGGVMLLIAVALILSQRPTMQAVTDMGNRYVVDNTRTADLIKASLNDT